MRTKRKQRKQQNRNSNWPWPQKWLKEVENKEKNSIDIMTRLERENNTKAQYNGNWAMVKIKFSSIEQKESCFYTENGNSAVLDHIVRSLCKSIQATAGVSYSSDSLGYNGRNLCRFVGEHSGPYIVEDNGKEYFCIIGEGTLSGAGNNTPKVIFSNFEGPSIFIRDCSVEDSWEDLLKSKKDT